MASMVMTAPSERRAQFANPEHEAGLELFGVEQRKDPSERVVGGDPVGKWELLAQPVQFHLAPLDNQGPALGAADDCADGRQQQFVELIVAQAGVRAPPLVTEGTNALSPRPSL